MQQTTYYCDVCEKEIKKYDITLLPCQQHGAAFQKIAELFYMKDIIHTHKECLIRLKDKLNNILPEKKK